MRLWLRIMEWSPFLPLSLSGRQTPFPDEIEVKEITNCPGLKVNPQIKGAKVLGYCVNYKSTSDKVTYFSQIKEDGISNLVVYCSSWSTPASSPLPSRPSARPSFFRFSILSLFKNHKLLIFLDLGSKFHPKLESYFRQNKSTTVGDMSIHDPLALRHLIFNILAPVCQQVNPLSHQDLQKLYDQIMALCRKFEDSMARISFTYPFFSALYLFGASPPLRA